MDAAKENGLKPADYMGGFAIDEMKIQVTFSYFYLVEKSETDQLKYPMNYTLVKRIPKMNKWMP